MKKIFSVIVSILIFCLICFLIVTIPIAFHKFIVFSDLELQYFFVFKYWYSGMGYFLLFLFIVVGIGLILCYFGASVFCLYHWFYKEILKGE